jgi:hypothetical protein
MLKSIRLSPQSCNTFVEAGQSFSKVFFLFPSPPEKRVKERVANQSDL